MVSAVTKGAVNYVAVSVGLTFLKHWHFVLVYFTVGSCNCPRLVKLKQFDVNGKHNHIFLECMFNFWIIGYGLLISQVLPTTFWASIGENVPRSDLGEGWHAEAPRGCAIGSRDFREYVFWWCLDGGQYGICVSLFEGRKAPSHSSKFFGFVTTETLKQSLCWQFPKLLLFGPPKGHEWNHVEFLGSHHEKNSSKLHFRVFYP